MNECCTNLLDTPTSLPPFITFLQSLLSNPESNASLVQDLETGCIIGIVEINQYRIQISEKDQLQEVIICKTGSNEMFVLSEKCRHGRLIEDFSSHFQLVVDGIVQKENGDKIKGLQTQDGIVAGYCSCYNCVSDIIFYEGYIWDGRFVCFGKFYYPFSADRMNIENETAPPFIIEDKFDRRDQHEQRNANRWLGYEGSIWNGQKWGTGIDYSQENPNHSFLWLFDKPTTERDELNYPWIKTTCKSLQVYKQIDYSFSRLSFQSMLSVLRVIIIQSTCIAFLDKMEVNSLPNLQTLCLSYPRSCSFENSINSVERILTIETNPSCRIVNCPSLKSIEIGDHIFSHGMLLEIENVDALESIVIGKGCFRSAPTFCLKGKKETNCD